MKPIFASFGTQRKEGEASGAAMGLLAAPLSAHC